jgi:CHAD domain-containing protein
MKEVLLAIISQLDFGKIYLQDPHSDIHECRKSVKRMRAVLKMVRDEAGYSLYFRENVFYRDLSRKLAPVRDHRVLLETLQLVETRYPELFMNREPEVVKKEIEVQTDALLQNLKDDNEEINRIARDLEQAPRRLLSTLRLRDGFVSIRKGIRRSYKNGRKNIQKRDGQFNMEALHEHRKNCRFLQYQMELIRPIFPKLLKCYAESLDDHTEVLGRIRDLQRLELYLGSRGPGGADAGVLSGLLTAIGKMRARSLEGVQKRARLIFAEKPGAFICRLHTYWDNFYNIT